MSKWFTTILAVVLTLSVETAYAQKGHGAKHVPQPHASVKPTVQQHGAAAQQRGPKPATHGHKPAATGPKAHGPSSASGTSAKPTHAKATRTTVSPSGAPLTPVQQKLLSNTNLASRVQSRLPAGTDLIAASAGFKNLGQFVAAANVSHNLGIPFDRLKTAMVVDGSSLGQAIHTLRPSADSDVEVRRAEHDADALIREMEAAPTAKSQKAKPRSPGNAPRR
jgi:hypothetical protein